MSEDTEFGWKEAAHIVAPVTPVAANFSSAVRTLMSSYEQGTIILSPGIRTHLLRLLRTSTIKATYYFGSKAYRPTLLSAQSPVTPHNFLNGYSAVEHATILTFTYLFKALARKSNAEEWEYVQAPLYEALAIGACIGQAVPEVGLAFGLMSRAMRYLAFAPFLISNKKAFKDYRRHLRSKDLPYDMEREEELWGCTNVQVAAMLMQATGFSAEFTQQFVAAAVSDPSTEPDELCGVRFRIAERLIHSYMEESSLPTKLPAWVGRDFSLTSGARDELLQALSKAISPTDRIEWLNKGTASINPQSTPELFEGGQVADSADAEEEHAEPAAELADLS